MRPFDESDLIAYHLHELPAKRVRELLQAFQKNPALAAESMAIATMLAEYKHHSPLDVAPNVMERNWHVVRNALPRVPVVPTPFFRWRLPVLAGVGLALAVPIFFVVHHPSSPEQKQVLTRSDVSDTGIPTSHPIPQTVTAPVDAMVNAPPQIPSLWDHSNRNVSRANTPRHSITLGEPQGAVAPANSNTEPASAHPLFPETPAPSTSAETSSSLADSTTAPRQAYASSQKNTPTRSKHRHSSDTDLTLSLGGTFIATRGTTTNGITNSEGANNTVNVIGSFHQQFRPFVGYRIAVSYTRPEFHYFRSTATSDSGEQGVKGRVYELAGTYVVRGPRREKLITYVEAGAGVMAILPPFPDTASDYNISPAGIVGVSADIPLSKHFGVHAAYRAQVFKGPDFHANPAVYPLANSNILISQEPSVGITYRFSQKQQ